MKTAVQRKFILICLFSQKSRDSIERLKENIEKNYNVLGGPARDRNLDLGELDWVANDETEGVVITDGETGDDDDSFYDYK